ncbi:MAG TPA: HD domain-containing phosphohydrolase, partial [Acidimicrobiales bacterium]|nr:HD domain-containing phosphohydrolase [Acidimicrobiales bacterium]
FEYGFLLHDIGKLTVPDIVLNKPGALTDEEWLEMRHHPVSGNSILEGIPFLAGAREIVFAHHEWYNGDGYPRHLAGEDIPLGARIFPVCDAFDAMMSDRPYRKALPLAKAIREIERGSGSQFWPVAVEAFLSLPPDALEVVAASTGLLS